MDTLHSSIQNYLATEFGRPHEVLIAAVIFPRLAIILLAPYLQFYPVYVVGWFYFPRITLAFLMVLLYWHSNPYLCVTACFLILLNDYERKYFLKGINYITDNWDELATTALKLGAFVVIGTAITIGLLNVPWTKTLIISVIVFPVIACGLYFFDQRRRRLYGIFEIVLGLSLGVFAIVQAGSNLSTMILTSVGFVFLMKEGLSNLGAIHRLRNICSQGEPKSSD